MMPTKSARATSRGTTRVMAMKRGTMRNLTGTMPIVVRASISSMTFMEAISAVIEAPTLPASMIPAMSGTSSSIMAMPMRSAK